MTDFIPIDIGQWVLAFNQPFGPYGRTMEEHLSRFNSRGGGWDHIRAREIFNVHRVEKVAPKTYYASFAAGPRAPGVTEVSRFGRYLVVGTGKSEAEMVGLRDKLYAVGADAEDRIEVETHRRMHKFAERERAKALKSIQRMFPAFFGGEQE